MMLPASPSRHQALPLGKLLPWLQGDAPKVISMLWSLILPAAILCSVAALSMNPIVVLGTAWGYGMHPQPPRIQPPPMLRTNIYCCVLFTEAPLNAQCCLPVTIPVALTVPTNPSR